MIKQWGREVPELTQGEWISFIDRCFCHVFGWDFSAPTGVTVREPGDTVPNPAMLYRMDLMGILSLGREHLLELDIDMEKAFILDEDYGHRDESEKVDQDRYDQLERLIDLAVIWGSHDNRYQNSKFVPMPTDTCKDIQSKMKEHAKTCGIDSEVDAYYRGVPLSDIVAGADENTNLYGFADWTVSFELDEE